MVLTGMGGPPGNLTTNEWQARFEDANATGTYHFEAYDVSDSFPPNKTASFWSATIQVTNITDDPDPESIPYPGTDISIKAPDGMKLPVSKCIGKGTSAEHYLVTDVVSRTLRKPLGSNASSGCILNDTTGHFVIDSEVDIGYFKTRFVAGFGCRTSFNAIHQCLLLFRIYVCFNSDSRASWTSFLLTSHDYSQSTD